MKSTSSVYRGAFNYYDVVSNSIISLSEPQIRCSVSVLPAFLCLLKYLSHIRQHFESAEVAAGLELSVTGVLGFRTVHQVKYVTMYF